MKLVKTTTLTVILVLFVAGISWTTAKRPSDKVCIRELSSGQSDTRIISRDTLNGKEHLNTGDRLFQH